MGMRVADEVHKVLEKEAKTSANTDLDSIIKNQHPLILACVVASYDNREQPVEVSTMSAAGSLTCPTNDENRPSKQIMFSK